MDSVDQSPEVQTIKRQLAAASCPSYILPKSNKYYVKLVGFQFRPEQIDQIKVLIKGVKAIYKVELLGEHLGTPVLKVVLRRKARIHQEDMLISLSGCVYAVIYDEFVRVGSAIAYSADNC